MKNLTREAKVLSMLQHPSIVRLYETIRCGSVYYLVTELATGGDLCTHIKEQPAGKLDENTARLYARQLVAALKHMHSKGVVHRITEHPQAHVLIPTNISRFAPVLFTGQSLEA
ncbi:Hormonally up-regulated neu tumor-associated kinase [Camponotus floridanus]|uniref:Hormonally up-regulated neu tumor-associated kinase n=1 Tax=Camponotus floridanus TaxID=104421 RepID=E2AZD8_CAMFO|nr:Hormonally up-regulated neu tumor-associated kinase [Camponotus floridanus]